MPIYASRMVATLGLSARKSNLVVTRKGQLLARKHVIVGRRDTSVKKRLAYLLYIQHTHTCVCDLAASYIDGRCVQSCSYSLRCAAAAAATTAAADDDDDDDGNDNNYKQLR